LPNSESVVSDHVTASVATVSGLVKGSIERVHLLTQAIEGARGCGRRRRSRCDSDGLGFKNW
jgi:Sec7-like guanine-nucleotide exchange factor